MGLQEHRRAVALANTLNDDLGRLIAGLGAASSRGKLISAYRNARRALKGNLRDNLAVSEALEELRTSVIATTREVMTLGSGLGESHSRRSLLIYNEQPLRINTMPIVEASVRPVLSAFEAQATAIQNAVTLGTFSEEEFLGDGERVGLVTHGSILRTSAKWVAVAVSATYISAIIQTTRVSTKRRVYVKQAIAGIDERTTDCCLRVTGQIQPIGGYFVLTGTPRYADKSAMPGFHEFCRTTTALVLEEDAQDTLTTEITDAARDELTSRKQTGKLIEIHPASATSRRP